jgi:hypothetical protein
MGLAPNLPDDFPANGHVCEVPVPIFHHAASRDIEARGYGSAQPTAGRSSIPEARRRELYIRLAQLRL